MPYNHQPSEMTAGELKSMGNLAPGLQTEDIDEIRASVIADALEDLADKDFDVSQCRAITQKVNN